MAYDANHMYMYMYAECINTVHFVKNTNAEDRSAVPEQNVIISSSLKIGNISLPFQLLSSLISFYSQVGSL